MPVSAALVVNFRFKNKYYKDMAKAIKPTKMLLYIERLKGYYSLLFYMMIYSANRSSNSHQYVAPLHNVLNYTHLYGVLYTIFVIIYYLTICNLVLLFHGYLKNPLDPLALRPTTLDFFFFYSPFIKFGEQYQVNVGSPSAMLA